ncbi:YidC/Oxa1 family membrane protein insertase [Peptoniphilus raoultii]|uniref:YidC/Oxa1 family membrane protein insertase n=1 Tax=Peptoniphilus raoultii TaxID=1776387 RepID=UPI0008D986EA|nr:YidC/Oxa1 family membrane protein insertase [Peptoniphilus raoultii]
MTKPISIVLGMFIRMVYNGLVNIMAEPDSISFYALSIIITTLILKLLILPITFSQMKNQKKMAELQPELQKLQKKYKNDPQTLAMKQQKLYKDANYNVLSGCLPLIVQLFVLIGFYRCFYEPVKFIFTEPGFYNSINKNFFYIESLDQIDKTMILPLLAAATTFLTSYLTTKTTSQGPGQDQAKSMMNTMMYMMPIMIFFMGRSLHSELILYWTVSNIFAIFQQLFVNRSIRQSAEESDEIRN